MSKPVTLRLLLVSGKSSDFNVEREWTVKKIKGFVFENWPSVWDGEKVSSVDVIRLLHRGKFLEENVTIDSFKPSDGEIVTMHLVPKSSESDKNEDDQLNVRNGSGGCCSIL